MILGMDHLPGETLCKACGLCCTGHLFVWVKLRPRELDPAERLGMTVFRSDPNQRGFAQPCPLWQGSCTIYERPEYPRACRSYRCKVLKGLQAGELTLAQTLDGIGQAKSQFASLEAALPGAGSFRERLVALVEADGLEAELREPARALLQVYEQVFGVEDLFE